MTEIYDRGYKKLFSNKLLFQQLLQSFVPFDWVKELDFEHCELLDKTFISKEYQKRESDVIYKIQWRGNTAYVVILIEFQSSSDKFMALRILHYITSFYMRLKDSEKKLDKLPPIFPIMVYSGLDKWTAPTNIAELIENNNLLGDFALNFNYFKIAENEISVERLLEIGNAVSTLFLGEVHHDRAALIQAFSKLYQQPDSQPLLSILLNYFEQLSRHNKLDEVDWQALDKIRSKQEINMFLENMKLCDETAYQKGISDGERKGILEGERAGKLATARAMLAEGLSIALITKITGFPATEIEQLRH
jgi:predicted transposase/invertase (TIGR01784 family)